MSSRSTDAADDTDTTAWLPAKRPRRARLAAAVLVVLLALAVLPLLSLRTPDGDLTNAGAVILGLVEGLTEWLPVSSTGHLLVTQRLLGISGDAADSYAIAIQAGAILAVLSLYPHRFVAILRGVAGRDADGRRLLIALVAASLPAATIGLAFEDVIKARLFGPWPIVIAWFVGGVAILVVAHRRRHRSPLDGEPLTALTWRVGLAIGVAQTLALWPGVSRSLVTILAASVAGLAVPAAVEFSFLLGFVVLSGATAYETLSSGGAMVEAYGYFTPLLGLVVAYISALVAMRWLVAYLERRGLGVFGWYRIALASLVAALLATGAL